MRGSLVPLAVCVVASCPRCRSIPSFERFLSVPRCRAGNYSAAALHLARCANGRRCAHSARVPLPALSVPHAGPQLPAAPPGLRPESGCRATPSVFVGSRQPPVTRGTRHGRCVPRLQGAAALRGRVSGGWRLGRASARALLSLGGLPLLSVACRLWGAPGFATLRSGHPIGLLPCGRPPRARRGRRTPLSSRRRPKRFCPLEPLSPHAACARTRPPFGRPLPRFSGAGSAWLARSGREPFRLTGLTL